MKVTILRGVPGSGKSCYAQTLYREQEIVDFGEAPEIVSADDYFMVGGQYRFDATKLQLAHRRCLANYSISLSNGRSIIVDNTNTTPWEVATYYQLAEMAEAEIQVVRIYCDPVVAWKRNVHDVPLKLVLEMHQRLMSLPLPPWVKEEVILAEELEIK